MENILLRRIVFKKKELERLPPDGQIMLECASEGDRLIYNFVWKELGKKKEEKIEQDV